MPRRNRSASSAEAKDRRAARAGRFTCEWGNCKLKIGHCKLQIEKINHGTDAIYNLQWPIFNLQSLRQRSIRVVPNRYVGQRRITPRLRTIAFFGEPGWHGRCITTSRLDHPKENQPPGNVTFAIPSDRRRRSPSTDCDALAGPRFSPNLATSPATAPPLAWLLTPVLLSPDRSRYTPQAIRVTPRGWLSFFCQ